MGEPAGLRLATTEGYSSCGDPSEGAMSGVTQRKLQQFSRFPSLTQAQWVSIHTSSVQGVDHSSPCPH